MKLAAQWSSVVIASAIVGAVSPSWGGEQGVKDSVKPITNNVNATVSPAEDTIVFEGKTYHTVKIGKQVWLKENLDVGTMISGNKDASDDGKIEKYYYNNDPANGAKYGGLYQWDEAMGYSKNEKAQGICPKGWHIPTYDEFMELKSAVSRSGNALKAVGQGNGNGAGTDKSGFSALLGGIRMLDGNFHQKGSAGVFWTSSSERGNEAVYMNVADTMDAIDINKISRTSGFSVRCIKD